MTLTARRSGGLLAAMLCAMTVQPIAQTMVVPILPSLAGEFAVSASDVSWVMTANLLAAAVLTPILGRLGDLHGRRRLLLLSLLGTVAGSVLAVSTHSFALLLVARALHGIGGGVLPLAFGVIRAELPPERAARGMAMVSTSMGIGSGLGVVAAGLLMEWWDYRAVFWLLLVLGLLAAAAVALSVPADRGTDREGGGTSPLAAVTLAVWLCALLVAVSQGNGWGWTGTRVLGLLSVAAVVCALWLRVESRTRHPLIDLRMLARPTVALTNLAATLTGFGMYGAYIVMTSFAQVPQEYGFGFSATVLIAGLMLLPNSAGNLAAGTLAAALIARRGPRTPLVLGGFLGAAAMAFLTVRHGSAVDLYLAGGVFGLGTGLAFAAIPVYVNSAVPPGQTAVANGTNAVLRTIGAAAGSAVTGAVLAGDTVAGTASPTLHAYQAAFMITAAGFLAAAAVPFAIRSRPVPVHEEIS
ncbi:MFS transporter [Streptosporangium sp. NPDC003464]